jgi:hypothetical protein
MICINQNTGIESKEPLKSLAIYRRQKVTIFDFKII